MEKKKVMELAYKSMAYQRNAVHAGMCTLVAEASLMHLELNVDPEDFQKRDSEYEEAIGFRTRLINTLDTARENIAGEYEELFGIPIK